MISISDRNIPSSEDLVKIGIALTETVLELVETRSRLGLLRKTTTGGKNKGTNNTTYLVDKIAQKTVENKLKTIEDFFGCKILVLGEEKDTYPDTLEGREELVVFVDPIDGTDLLVRGFSNWCLALAFYYPPEKKILAAIVGQSSGIVYYATPEGAFKQTVITHTRADGRTIKEEHRQQLNRNSKRATKLEHASICFYGQKPRAFLTLAESSKFIKLMGGYREQMQDVFENGKKKIAGKELRFRLYNLAGNPMMVRIPEGVVDAVLGLTEQEVHDVIPGTYIAIQGGAVFKDLTGNDIDPVQSLGNPRNKLNYILCGSANLFEVLRGLPKVKKKDKGKSQ